MLQNYFKIAWRNLVRNKTFSILNIAGLTIGIVCAALIFLWVEYSFEYNRQLPDADKIFTLKNNQTYGKDVYTMEADCGPLAAALKQEVVGVKDACRVIESEAIFSLGDKSIKQSGISADSNFFQIFKFPFSQKSGNNFLNNTYNIAISKKMAEAFFGKENPIGKAILYNRKQNFTVAAIYDIPSDNMQIKPAFVLPLAYQLLDSNLANNFKWWGNCNNVTYATLNDNAKSENVNLQLKDFIFKKSNGSVNQSVFLYPYTKAGLYNSFSNGKETPSEGPIKYIKMFSIIACIILLIACINFMNLSTARSENRAKEIGLKKVVGATRRQIVAQFMWESVITSLIAVVFSIVALAVVVTPFGKLIGTPLQLNLLNPLHLFSLLFIGGICGIISGIYPAFYLSSFNPIRALKKQTAKTVGGVNILRKGLVIIQFTISVVMIICTIVIFNQINYTKNRDLGFDKDNIMIVGISESLANGYDALKQNLLATGVVKDVALSWNNMFNMYSNGSGFRWKGYDGQKGDALITMNAVSSNYLQLMGIKVSEGRYFHDNVNTDSNNIIINSELAKLMGVAGKVGGRIYQNDVGTNAMNIVGVTDEFVYNNIYGKPSPMYFFSMPPKNFASWGNIFIKLKPMQGKDFRLTDIQASFKKIDHQYPFDYKFLDDSYNKLFHGALFVGTLAMLFGGLAIFISCLGLFGLAAFMAEQRTKEIGIRKILGASVFSITQLLNKSFLKLVALSSLIAFPIAWWYMHNWLQNYEYRVKLEWWVFALAAIVSVIISIVTISFQSIKAAVANPVKSLRTE